MEATLSQQAKLIDYLQAKVENPPKKKKGVSSLKAACDLGSSTKSHKFYYFKIGV